MKFISSISSKDCLFQDLKMLLAYLNKDDEYLFLPNPHLNKEYSFKEIVDLAKEYNLNLVGFECTNKDELLKSKKHPLIVLMKGESKHAVIVERFCKKKVKIIDPAQGLIYLSIDEFFKNFDGYGLYVSSFKKTKCPEKGIKPMEKSDLFFITILEFISGVCCLLGTYFVSATFPFYLSIIFFTFFFVFEIILRRYSVQVMEKMDEKYLYSIKHIDNYFDYYQKYNNFKASSLLALINMIFSILMTFFICFILLLNSLFSLINIGIVVAFVLLNCYIDKAYLKPKNNKISSMESKINTVNNIADFVSLTRKINKEGYHYGLIYKLKRYVTLGIYLFTTILVMALSSNAPIDISYLIFNFVIMILLDQYLTTMISTNGNLEKYQDSKNYINQYFKR